MAQAGGMTRLVRLYARVEQMRSLQRRVAAQAVDEADTAVSIHAAVYAHALADGRASLGAGDCEQWAIAQAAQTLRARHREHLERLRADRETTLADAVELHRESRLTMEQVERVIANTNAQRALNETRSEQTSADDRFASRAAWRRSKRAE